MILAVALAAVAGCLLIPWLDEASRMVAIELAAGIVLGAWAATVGLHISRAARLRRELAKRSYGARVGEIAVRVIAGADEHAFVLGVLRPAIFLGEALFSLFDEDELHAVVLHEQHHQRTRAPLRSAALEAWLNLLGWDRRIRSLLVARLAALETEADRHAIRSGATAPTIASALLKGTAGELTTLGFSTAAEERIAALLLREGNERPADAGRRTHRDPALPVEWLPAISVIALVAGCHMAGLLHL